ncbi:MAG: hypothetical protein Q7S52_02455 [bacterium]|nr:hypothetical protein [bacterium]
MRVENEQWMVRKLSAVIDEIFLGGGNPESTRKLWGEVGELAEWLKQRADRECGVPK